VIGTIRCKARVFKDKVVLKQPAFGIAAGQACVCCTGSRLIGGGWITAAENQALQQAA
jgi:tRNA U34 2-thiouridine synthase MnmA/TrmU